MRAGIVERNNENNKRQRGIQGRRGRGKNTAKIAIIKLKGQGLQGV
jgi:hypothetical protein